MLRGLADENFHGHLLDGLLQHTDHFDIVRAQDVGLAGLVRFLRQFRGGIVADPGRQRSAQHQALLDQFLAAFAVGPQADDALVREPAAPLGQQFHREQQIVGDERFEDVEFEMALQAAHGDGRIAAVWPVGRRRSAFAATTEWTR